MHDIVWRWNSTVYIFIQQLISVLSQSLLPKFMHSPTELLSCWCSKSLKHVSMHLVLNICIVFCINGIICVIKIELMLKYVAGWQLVPGIFLSYSICLWLYLNAFSNAKGVVFQISEKLVGSCSLALGVCLHLLKQLYSYCSYIFRVQINPFGAPWSYWLRPTFSVGGTVNHTVISKSVFMARHWKCWL